MRTLMLALSLLLAAALPVHAQQPPALPGLTAGVDYTPIDGGKPFQQQAAGKIEVIEVFAYWCPHCAHMQPLLETWKAGLPTSVAFSYMPAAFFPNDPFMLGFFAANAIKAVPLTHARMFAALHETGELSRSSTVEQVAGFYEHLPGIDAKAFQSALDDRKSMGKRMLAAREFQIRSKLEGTPAIIVDGRYLILGNSYDNLLVNARRVIDAIAATSAKPAKPSAPPRS